MRDSLSATSQLTRRIPSVQGQLLLDWIHRWKRSPLRMLQARSDWKQLCAYQEGAGRREAEARRTAFRAALDAPAGH